MYVRVGRIWHLTFNFNFFFIFGFFFWEEKRKSEEKGKPLLQRKLSQSIWSVEPDLSCWLSRYITQQDEDFRKPKDDSKNFVARWEKLTNVTSSHFLLSYLTEEFWKKHFTIWELKRWEEVAFHEQHFDQGVVEETSRISASTVLGSDPVGWCQRTKWCGFQSWNRKRSLTEEASHGSQKWWKL
jgi:hypothetical protein